MLDNTTGLMARRTVLVTGGTGGISKATAAGPGRLGPPDSQHPQRPHPHPGRRGNLTALRPADDAARTALTANVR